VEDYLTVEEVAKKLAVSPKTVYRWFKQRKLKGIKAGHLVRISPASLLEFQQVHQNSGGESDVAGPTPPETNVKRTKKIAGFRHLPPSPGEV